MRATHRGDRVDRHISSVGAQEFIHVSPDGQAVRFLGGAEAPSRHNGTVRHGKDAGLRKYDVRRSPSK